MKLSRKHILTAVLLLVAAICLCGCSDQWEAPYASLDTAGHSISIRFDINGGLFAGTKEVSVVDVYNLADGVPTADGKVGFYLLTPGDSTRAEGAFSASRNGYFLAGWYAERKLRVDENGQPLDEYGVLCSVSGRPQGYTYANMWDFDQDMVTVDPNGTYQADNPVLTLYAAWVPYINYDIYCVNVGGEPTYLSTTQSIDLELPQWNQKTGKLDMKKFPTQDGKTFDAAYLDAELTHPLENNISGTASYVNYETGTISTDSVKIYTTWLDGIWYKIYSAQQFASNARLDGNYIICNDLDFTDIIWPPTLIKGRFTGTILGNGHTFSNISAIQVDNSQIYGGLFGTLEDGATITDLAFENACLTIDAGSRMQGAAFGLLTGSLSSNAVLSNVTVTGTLYISENCYPQPDYTIGLLCGIGSNDGVSYTIDCKTAEDNATAITVTVNDDGTVTVTFVTP